MAAMSSPVDALAARLVAITAIVARTARRGAVAMTVAALVAGAVLLLPDPSGFGRRGALWWLLVGALFVPAGVVFLFSRTIAALRGLVEGWRRHVASIADEAVAAVADMASTVQTAVIERRGIGRLVIGVLGLRRLLATFRELTGTAAPAAAAVSPGLLGLTALAVAAGVGVAFLALVLVLARVIV